MGRDGWVSSGEIARILQRRTGGPTGCAACRGREHAARGRRKGRVLGASSRGAGAGGYPAGGVPGPCTGVCGAPSSQSCRMISAAFAST